MCYSEVSVPNFTLSPSTPTGLPVPPKRKKRMSMAPDQLESMTSVKLLVEAVYDCTPDHRDELDFKEGDVIVVTKKISKDWWVSHVTVM